jgi:hypothetical protein
MKNDTKKKIEERKEGRRSYLRLLQQQMIKAKIDNAHKEEVS